MTEHLESDGVRMDRRNVVRGIAVLGAAVPSAALLAACGDDDPKATPTTGGPPTGAATTGGGAPGGALAKKTDIPVGGGKIFGDQGVVVTQPTAGDFKGFTAVCTHNGCTVSSVEDGKINCGCHGSAFSVKDGSVANGPARSPLAAKQLKVDGDSISLA